LTRRLQAAGAEAVAVTSIAEHFCIHELEVLAPLPVINAIPEIKAELVNLGCAASVYWGRAS
jgi:aspartate racemase